MMCLPNAAFALFLSMVWPSISTDEYGLRIGVDQTLWYYDREQAAWCAPDVVDVDAKRFLEGYDD
ncbi:MAG TPA: hypothetical protein VIG24_12865 [Acidimicrobiia bacterium]